MDAKQLRERFEAQGIRRVKVGGFDVDGVLRGKFVSLEKFWSAVEEGFGFCDVIFGWDVADALYDNAEVTGWHTGYPDAHAQDRPRHASACCPASRTPQPSCSTSTAPTASRIRLARATSSSAWWRAPRAWASVPCVGAEFEFFVFRETPETLAAEGLPRTRAAHPGHVRLLLAARRSAQRTSCTSCSTPASASTSTIEGFHTETGPGVYEAAIRYDEALASRGPGGALQDRWQGDRPPPRTVASPSWPSGTRSCPARAATCTRACGTARDRRTCSPTTKARTAYRRIGRHYLGGLLEAMARADRALLRPPSTATSATCRACGRR